MKKNLDVSIIIVNWNTKDLLLDAVNSIVRSKPKATYEIIVVDNGSEDDSVISVKKVKGAKLTVIENKENLGFSKANNQGIKIAKGEYILLLNSDTQVKGDAIDKMLEFAEDNPDAGVVGARLLNRDESLQESVFRAPTLFNAVREYWFGEKGLYDKYVPQTDVPIAVDNVVGAAFLITPKARKAVGMLNEKYFFFWEDLDYCRAVRSAGMKVYYLPSALVYHYHGSTVRKVTDKSTAWKNLVPGSKIYYGRLMHELITFVLWTGQKFGKLIPISLIIFLTIPTVWQLLKPGFFPMQDDLQAFRVHQMDRCFDDGQIPCRWVPDAGYQYGYPQFNYYPPLPYYIGAALHRVGLQYIDTVKVLFIFGYFASALAMYWLVKNITDKYSGVVAALLYTYIPYKAVEVYVRGALSEFWAQIFFPLIFLGIYKVIKTRKLHWSILLALSIFGLMTTHLLMTQIFVPIAGLWTLFWLWSDRQKGKTAVSVACLFTSGALGFGLSAFFVLPVLFERQYVHLETLLSGYFDYRAHFLSLHKMLLSMEWGYGSSGFPDEKLNLSTGVVHWILGLIVAPIIALILYKKGRQNKKISLIVFGLAGLELFVLFMMHMKSSPIWIHLPSMWFLQFPWRIMAVSIFLLSLIISYTSHQIGKWKYVFGVVGIAVAFVMYINFFVPKDWYYITDKEKFSGVSWEKQLTISIFDYLPVAATLPPIEKAPLAPEVLEGNVEFHNYVKGSDFHRGELTAKEDSIIRIPMYDFPGMEVKLDVQKVAYRIDDCRDQDFCYGLMTIDVPKGHHYLSVDLKDTPVRTVGNILTLISLGVLGYVGPVRGRKISWFGVRNYKQ